MQDAKLLVKPKKSKFYIKEINYLKYIIRSRQIIMQTLKVKVIKHWPVPTNVKKVRGFFRYINFYRQFIKNYRGLAKPFINLTKKDKEF